MYIMYLYFIHKTHIPPKPIKPQYEVVTFMGMKKHIDRQLSPSVQTLC